jgi:hypothetical protein
MLKIKVIRLSTGCSCSRVGPSEFSNELCTSIKAPTFCSSERLLEMVKSQGNQLLGRCECWEEYSNKISNTGVRIISGRACCLAVWLASGSCYMQSLHEPVITVCSRMRICRAVVRLKLWSNSWTSQWLHFVVNLDSFSSGTFCWRKRNSPTASDVECGRECFLTLYARGLPPCS